MNQTVFIIDIYDKFFARLVSNQIRQRFLLNDNWYAIYEVPLEWGRPKMIRPIEEEQMPDFRYFETLEEAQNFVKRMKKINDGL